MKFSSPVSTTSTVDFSGATSTKPNKSGTSLPATCSVSETFFKTDATAGQNLYLATATNTWTQVAGGDANAVTAAGTLTSNAPVIGGGSKAVAVGTRSGNTTEFATITGSKTVDKQLKFDASGNIVASTTDVGAAAGGSRTVLHYAYNTDVPGDNTAGQVWATYTIAGGTLAVGDIVEVRCQLRKTAGTTNDKHIAMYFGNGNAPAYGMVLETDKQYTYYIDWLVATSSSAMAMGFKGSAVGATNVGNQADTAVDASSLNLANDIIVKMQTILSGQIDNTNTIKVVSFLIVKYRPV